MSTRLRHLAPIGALLLVAVVAAAGIHVTGGTEPTAAPLPFDPLSDAEQTRAVSLAENNPLVAFLLNDYETIGAALHTDKQYSLENHPRLADVWFYDYTTDQTIWAVVDLGTGLVTLEPVLVPFQPPLTGGEMARAEAIALAHPGIRERLPDGAIVSGSHLWTGPGTPCPVHRCVTVGFYMGATQLYSFFPLVDLSTGKVIDIIENEWFEQEVQA